MISVVVCCLLLFLSAARGDCVVKRYGTGNIVCVCNATYCDVPPPLPQILPRHYYLYTSTKDGLRFNLTRRKFSSKIKTRSTVFTLDAETEFQNVEGFGGAFTDSAGINIASLSEGSQEKLLEAYFSPLGIGYTLGRVPIAGTDFSTRPYTYDDTDYDVGLKKFNLTKEDFAYKIPYIKKAMILTNHTLRLLAAAWTAPPWMKTNEDYSGLGFLQEKNYEDWGRYHIRFLDEYQKEGINIWALSTGNEPINGAIPFFPFNCMGWTPLSQRTWVSKFLGPALENSPHNRTLLLALDDQRFQLPWWISIMFHKSQAKKYISGVGVHWYWDHIAPLSLLDKTHNEFPNLMILSTEACFTKRLWEDSPVHLGSWSRAEQYTESIIDDMNHWVAGWVDWNLALNPSGGPSWANNVVDAAIIVNRTADEFYKQPMFYALGHFSKFVPVGSRRVELNGETSGLKGIAFLTPQDLIVLVLLNKKNEEQAVSIAGAPRGIANFVMSGKSITTLICRNKKLPFFKMIDEDDL